MIFDTHAHYDQEAFDQDREELLQQLPQAGVGGAVNIGADLASSQAGLALSQHHTHLWAAVGVHPDCVAQLEELGEERATAWFHEQLAHPRAVAVGEIGLDYHWDTMPRPVQKRWFDFQLEVAAKAHLPVVIHSRDAAADTLEQIRAAQHLSLTMVIHCFSYEQELARQYLDMGHYLGVGGVLTYKNSRKLKEVVEIAPLERILLETDCPYLSPVPYRGQRNSSLYLPYVVDAIAQIKGVDRETVEAITWENAMRFYGLHGKINPS